MQTRRFGKTLKLPSTAAIKHQITKSMLDDLLKAEPTDRAEVGPFFKPAGGEPNATLS
jgi:hypothetical protein